MAHHFIGYASAGSATAKRLGRADTGCYYYQLGIRTRPTPFDTYDEAKAHADAQGTQPAKYRSA